MLLVDALHSDTRISDAASLLTLNALADLVCPWLIEICPVSCTSDQVSNHLDSMTFSPGLQLITLRSMQSPRAPLCRRSLYQMKHRGFAISCTSHLRVLICILIPALSGYQTERVANSNIAICALSTMVKTMIAKSHSCTF